MLDAGTYHFILRVSGEYEGLAIFISHTLLRYFAHEKELFPISCLAASKNPREPVEAEERKGQ